MDQLGISKSSFIGHSMGSVISQRLAIDFPNRVEKIILVGSVANITKNEPLGGLADVVATLMDPIDQTMVKEFVESLFFNDFSDNMFFVDQLTREELLAGSNTWVKGLHGLLSVDNRAELHLISAPTLIIWGDQDQLFSRQDQADLIEGIPNAKLLVWENIGHAMQWEDPKRMTMDIKAFLGY